MLLLLLQCVIIGVVLVLFLEVSGTDMPLNFPTKWSGSGCWAGTAQE